MAASKTSSALRRSVSFSGVSSSTRSSAKVVIEVDDGAKQDTKLRVRKGSGSAVQDSLEGGGAGLALFLAAITFFVVLLVFAFLFLLALLGHAFLPCERRSAVGLWRVPD